MFQFLKHKKIILNFGLPAPQLKRSFILLGSFCILIFVFCILETVKGAELNLISDIQEIGIGQQFQVDIMLDPEDQSINAMEGKILFPSDLVELKEIRDSNSIVNLWLERPSLATDNTVVFSGIIPGGFEGVLSPYYEGGRPGRVFSLIFLAKNDGPGIIEIKDGKVLLHDGKGTLASLSISNFQFSISKEISISETPILEIEDTDPPEDFIPEIARDPNIFDGKWFLVFTTQDKGSGIDHYEILEKKQPGSLFELFRKDEWEAGGSPYLLKDQELKSQILVKAVDKAGNERIAALPSQNPLQWYDNYYIWIKIIIGIIIIYIIWKVLRKKRSYMPVC